MYPVKVIVWCNFWSGDVIGPYFLKKNGARKDNNRDDLRNELEGMDIQNMRFQQDKGTCHSLDDTIIILRERFTVE